MLYSCLFIAVCAIFKSIKDTLAHHYDTSIFKGYNDQFFDNRISWKNKWNDDGKEKFFGSSTIFVWVTDGWHLAQFFEIKFLLLAIVFYTPFNPVLDFFVLWGIYSFVFEAFYSKLWEI